MSAAAYNLTNLSSAATITSQITALNQLSGMLLASAILFTLYIVLFLTFKNQGLRIAMTGISFIMTIIATLMWYLKYIPGEIAIIPLVIFILSIIGLYLFDE